MNFKKYALAAAIGMTASTGFANVCDMTNAQLIDQIYYGTVTCTTGTILNINVFGSLTLNGTIVQGSAIVRGNLTATNANIRNIDINGTLQASNTKVTGNVVSNGPVYLNTGSVIVGQLKSSTGQIFVDSSSEIQGNAQPDNPIGGSQAAPAQKS